METTIYVPARFTGNLSAQVSIGDSTVTRVNGEKIYVKNSAKNLRVTHCRFNTFDMHASAGSLECTDCAADVIVLHASAGSMKVENTSGVLDAHCSAGSLSVVRHTGEGMKVHSSASNVLIKDCEAAIDAHSSAGNVQIQCDGRILQRVTAHSSAGDIKLQAAETDDIDLTSSAGNIKVCINQINGSARMQSSAGNVILEAAGIKGNIDAKASTGGVYIKLPDDVNCRIETSTRMGSVKRNIRGNDQSPYVLRATASMGTIELNPIN